MGLTDFVVANRADAQLVCDSTCPSEEFLGMDAKGIDTVKLGTLNAILTGTEFDPQFVSRDELATGGEDGPWVFEVPTDFVHRLAVLDAEQLRAAAVQWAKTEEFSSEYCNWSPEEVHQMLQDLTRLSVRAVAERKSVLMWMSL